MLNIAFISSTVCVVIVEKYEFIYFARLQIVDKFPIARNASGF